MLKQIGLEIVYNDESQKVLYVAFITNDIRDKFYDAILQQENFEIEELNCDNMIIKWQHGDVSNYDYLLYLNSLADRSRNDLTQYPVFPWILKDYTSEEIDLKDIKVFRNLQKPIGALNEDRLGKLKERCMEMVGHNIEIFAAVCLIASFCICVLTGRTKISVWFHVFCTGSCDLLSRQASSGIDAMFTSMYEYIFKPIFDS